MAGTQTQHWDSVLEFNQSALSRQVSVGLQQLALEIINTTLVPFDTIPGSRGPISVVFNVSEIGLYFVPGADNSHQLNCGFVVTMNSVHVPYITRTEQPGQIATGVITFGMRAPETYAYLDLERAVLRLDEDRIAAIGSEWLSGLIAVG